MYVAWMCSDLDREAVLAAAPAHARRALDVAVDLVSAQLVDDHA
jgi:hypothetical protein